MDEWIKEILDAIRHLDEKRYDALRKYQESRTLDSLHEVFTAFDQYFDPKSVQYFKYLFDFLEPGEIRLASIVISGRHYFVTLSANGDLSLWW